MRILLVSDAWSPQVNGVVRTLQRVRQECEALGHEVAVISPEQFGTVPCPTYPEIRLALRPGRTMARRIEQFRPSCIHIATEGPLGFAARRYCIRRGLPFTTSYHTRFPEYVHARFPVPLAVGYAFMRWFHRPSSGVMVATSTIRDDLESRGFVNVKPWSRGVDTELFRPDHAPALDLPRPVFLYVGRVAVEKNLEAFLDAPIARAASSWSATARRWRGSRRSTRTCISPAPGTASSSPATTPAATCSCSPAAPTPSGWCCSRRWPRACR